MRRPSVPSCGVTLGIAAAVAVVSLSAQGPARSPGASTGTIAGVVVQPGTGGPIRDARVSLTTFTAGGGAPPVPRSSVTDAAGRFSFAGLPPGPYRVSVQKPGHVMTFYGQRKPGSSGTTIRLAAGQSIALSIPLPRGGVISGTVVDDGGEPLLHASVQALRRTMAGGTRRYQSSIGTNTDDRGMYRLHSLEPGEYVVCAMARNTQHLASDRQQMLSQIAGMRRAAENGSAPPSVRKSMLERAAQMEAQLPASGAPSRAYAPVCAPAHPREGSPVLTIGAGEEQAGIDLQLAAMPAATVSGSIVTPASGGGPHPDGVRIRLVNTDAALASLDMNFTTAEPSGSFLFPHVVPGTYRLIAQGGPHGGRTGGGRAFTMLSGPGAVAAPPPAASQADQAPPLWAMQDIVVSGEDVTGLVLELQRGLTVSGHLEFRGASAAPKEAAGAEVGLFPHQSVQGGPVQLASSATGRSDDEGRFVITDVMPGSYRPSASLSGRTWVLQSATLDGQEYLDRPLEVGPGRALSGLVLTYTDRPTVLSGSITDAKGEPAMDAVIVLFAADETLWIPGSRHLRLTRPMPDGTYEFRGMPPGDYRIATLIDEDPSAWSTPEVLRSLSTSAARLTLGEGEKKVHPLVVP